MPKKKMLSKNRTKSRDVNVSIDNRYTNHINELYKKKYNIKVNKNELENIKQQLSLCKSKGDPKMSVLHREKKRLEEVIKDIENDTEIKDFILKTCDIVTEYIEIDEHEKMLYKNNDELSKDENSKLWDGNDTRFGIIQERKRLLTLEYNNITRTENNFDIDTKEESTCKNCNIGLKKGGEGQMVCEECGLCVSTIELSEELSYNEKQSYIIKTPFTYDKTSYLSTWLKSTQAKDNIDLPKELIENVKSELVKQRITDTIHINYDCIRSILKKLKYNKYYICIPRILYNLTNISPLQLTPEMEAQLEKCFKMIVTSFENHKRCRKSLLSYSYIICKLYQMYGLDEYVQFLPMLKDNNKIRDHDIIYRKIVEEITPMDPTTPWSFTPTL
jgi:hypothetical protein